MKDQTDGRELKSLDYRIGHYIKNSDLASPNIHISRYQSFCNVAQMLFDIRANPSYQTYTGEESKRVYDLLGLRSNQILEGDLKRTHKLVRETRSPGMLTDLSCAFRRKLATLPMYNPQNLGINDREKNPNWWDNAYRSESKGIGHEYSNDEFTLSLYQASSSLSEIMQNWQLGLNAIWFAPNLCNSYEKMREHYQQARKHWDQEGWHSLDTTVQSDFEEFFKGNRIAILENPTNVSLDFVREFAPEKFERFSKAALLI